jgi:HK97 family phage prohead protease
MEFKEVKFSEVDESGIFIGKLTVYGEKDAYNDIVEKGAFTKTIKEKSKYPLLWQHNREEVIGVAYLSEKADYVEVTGEINLETQRGKEAYALLKQGAINGLSYGYDVIDYDIKGNVRYLKEIKLYEVSLVTFPALEKANVVEVKMIVDDCLDFPVADDNASWDESVARRDAAKWASSDGSGDKDKIDWRKYRKFFLYVDPDNQENMGGYKFPVVRLINGEPHIIPRGVIAARVYANRASISDADKEKLISVLKRLYKKIGREWGDEEKEYAYHVTYEFLDNISYLKDDPLIADVYQKVSSFMRKDNEQILREILNEIKKFKEEVSK